MWRPLARRPPRGPAQHSPRRRRACLRRRGGGAGGVDVEGGGVAGGVGAGGRVLCWGCGRRAVQRALRGMSITVQHKDCRDRRHHNGCHRHRGRNPPLCTMCSTRPVRMRGATVSMTGRRWSTSPAAAGAAHCIGCEGRPIRCHADMCPRRRERADQPSYPCQCGEIVNSSTRYVNMELLDGWRMDAEPNSRRPRLLASRSADSARSGCGCCRGRGLEAGTILLLEAGRAVRARRSDQSGHHQQTSDPSIQHVIGMSAQHDDTLRRRPYGAPACDGALDPQPAGVQAARGHGRERPSGRV